MNVLLVKPPSEFPTRIPHLGLGYLAAALRRRGHAVRLADCPRDGLDERGLLAQAAEWAPRLVGLSAFTADVPALRGLCRGLRAALPEAALVVGGPHPSCLPEHLFGYIPEIDYAFAGEAETGLALLADGLAGGGFDPAAVPGLAWREAGGVRANPPHLEPDLDALGLPAWDLLRPEIPVLAPHGAFVRRLPAAPIVTSRGCPFPCTFCAARAISGRRIRQRSLASVFEEVELLTARHGVREIHIEDDNFTFRRDYVMGFCEGLLRRPRPLPWCCPNGVRLDTLDRELLHLMRRAGCYSVSLGIESGAPRVLAMIRKGLEPEAIRERVAWIREAGIKTTGFFIIGFPTETAAEIEQTIRFARQLALDRAQFSTFLPLPGTVHFYELAAARGLDGIPWEGFRTTEAFEVPGGLPRAELVRLQRRAFLRFYARPGTLLRLAGEVRGPRHLAHLAARAAAVWKSE
jgi:radical SAM superfamily enzyme YgiQ (UPF0313 family)